MYSTSGVGCWQEMVMTYIKNLSRALRRHHIERLKIKRKNYWGYGTSFGREGISHPTQRQLGTLVQNPAVCSEYCCGNPRKHFNEITCKEKLHIIDVQLYLKGTDN